MYPLFSLAIRVIRLFFPNLKCKDEICRLDFIYLTNENPHFPLDDRITSLFCGENAYFTAEYYYDP